MNLPPEQAAVLMHLARSTIRASLSGQESRIETPSQPELLQPAGCFVSLHEIESHRLRGCVGRLDARDPMYLAVSDAARSVLHDPRFEQARVTTNELSRLEIEISLLSPLSDAPDPTSFDPQSHGICLTIGNRSGCFLPQVARETGWTREQLLERLCTEKMGMPANAWKVADARLQTFTAQI